MEVCAWLAAVMACGERVRQNAAALQLLLEYPDKYRLWSDLIQGNADRVFVATGDRPSIGSEVPVRLSLPGMPVQITIEGTVIGRRPASERFAAGVYVRFSDAQIEKCRRFLGLNQSPERYEQGRKFPRIACQLRVRFSLPEPVEGAIARNLSESGALISCPAPMSVGEHVTGELELESGAPWAFEGEVSWARNDKKVIGVRFLDVSAQAQARLSAALERLSLKAAEELRPTLVVADDEPGILDFLSRALAKHDYTVRQARRGEEALDLVRELKPQLVLLDILMPGLDGIDICKMMRADVEMADIPVLFLSALEPGRLHQLADESGATDYLSKPVNLQNLLNLVATYLNRPLTV